MDPIEYNGMVREALDEYFRKFGLGKDGGLNKKWAKLKVGPLYIPFPNTKARRKALVYHDIHHLITGYSGEWKGEASISAWEIASGCGNFYAAWFLDIGGLCIGIILFPSSTYNAFIRGSRSKNLYHEKYTVEEAKDKLVNELKTEMLPAQNPTATIKEKLIFTGWAFLSLFLSFGPVVLLIILFYHLFQQ